MPNEKLNTILNSDNRRCLISHLVYIGITYIMTFLGTCKYATKFNALVMGFPGMGDPGIPGGIATFYIKVTQLSEPLGMI